MFLTKKKKWKMPFAWLSRYRHKASQTFIQIYKNAWIFTKKHKFTFDKLNLDKLCISIISSICSQILVKTFLKSVGWWILSLTIHLIYLLYILDWKHSKNEHCPFAIRWSTHHIISRDPSLICCTKHNSLFLYFLFFFSSTHISMNFRISSGLTSFT